MRSWISQKGALPPSAVHNIILKVTVSKLLFCDVGALYFCVWFQYADDVLLFMSTSRCSARSGLASPWNVVISFGSSLVNICSCLTVVPSQQLKHWGLNPFWYRDDVNFLKTQTQRFLLQDEDFFVDVSDPRMDSKNWRAQQIVYSELGFSFFCHWRNRTNSSDANISSLGFNVEPGESSSISLWFILIKVRSEEAKGQPC